METGYVKFFDTREGKLFGFLVDEMGNEIFFHYSGGCTVSLDANREIAFEVAPPRFPKMGDQLMFKRGQNAKGAKATAWCFERDYDEMRLKIQRDLTLDEAKQFLADKPYDLLEHVYTSRTWGFIAITKETSIHWSVDGRHTLGNAHIIDTTETFDDGKPYKPTKRSGFVDVRADEKKFRLTHFVDADAETLMNLGIPRSVRKGVKVHVMWNGGSDTYVVDPTAVRDMTSEELEKYEKSSSPTVGRDEWLRCYFAKEFGSEQQVVKVLSYLGGHE